MKASIIVPTYNRCALIDPLINSLQQQSYKNIEIILIDDASTDGSWEHLQTYQDQCILIKQKINQGPSNARNRAALMATGDVLFFIDSDCLPDPLWVEEIIKIFEQKKDIHIVSGKTLDQPVTRSYMEFVNQGMNYLGNKEGIIKTAFTCNLAIRRQTFIEYEFDTKLPYSEDIDLMMRMQHDGHQIYFNPSAIVHHHHRHTVSSSLTQQWNWGFWNTIVRSMRGCIIPNSFGSAVMEVVLFLFIAALFLGIFNVGSQWVVASVYLIKILLLGYLVHLFLVLKIQRHRTFIASIISYPGFFLESVANNIGSLFGNRYFWWGGFKRRHHFYQNPLLSILSRKCGVDLCADGRVSKAASTVEFSCALITRNRLANLATILEDLAKQNIQTGLFEVIVVDSGEKSAEKVCEQYNDRLAIHYKKMPNERKLGPLRNASIETASGKYILFLDDDTRILDKEFLTRAKSIVTQVDVDVVMPKGQGINGSLDSYSWATRCLLIKRKTLARFGGMRSALPAYDDIELGIRMAAHGITLIKTDQLMYQHPSLEFKQLNKPHAIGRSIKMLRKYYPFCFWIVIYLNALRFLIYGFFPVGIYRQFFLISWGVLTAKINQEDAYY